MGREIGRVEEGTLLLLCIRILQIWRSVQKATSIEERGNSNGG